MLEKINNDIQKNPEEARLYVEKAIILFDMGRYQEALECSDLAISKEKGHLKKLTADVVIDKIEAVNYFL